MSQINIVGVPNPGNRIPHCDLMQLLEPNNTINQD